ncbi:MAG: WYL domain-containing protein [Myxococcaceae bacterium]|nr:WYL domain-containing protein [Myxococcaceae bacterium]
MSRPKNGRLSGIRRTVSLISDLMSGKTLNARTAAERLGVKGPAAARQLRAIEELPGVARTTDGKAHTWDFTPPASTLGYDKVIAACFGSSMAPAFDGTTYRQGFEAVRQWLIDRSPHRRHFRNIDRKFLVLLQGNDVSLSVDESPLDDVLDALLKEKRIAVEYERFSGEKQSLVVDPLSLVLYQHRLYLLVRTEDGHRALRFARIQAVEARTRFSYPSPTEYNPDQIFQRSFGVFLNPKSIDDIEFKLTPRWRVFVRTHRWHSSQTSKEVPDGVLVRLRVGICPELEGFLLSLGSECEVLNPPLLRRKIAEAARMMSAMYEPRP